MGIGDYLMMTAVAREAVLNNKNINQVRIFKIYERKRKNILINKHFVFKHNPYIHQGGNLNGVLDIYFGQGRNPKGGQCYHYNQGSHKGHWTINNPKIHAITQYCRHFKFNDNPELKCEMYFSETEHQKINSLIKNQLKGEPFIVIEPHTKKFLFMAFEKYQNLVDQLKDQITIVQTGKSKSKVLKGVINLVGKLKFREVALLIQSAKLVIAPEGGLMHTTNAVGSRGVFIFPGFLDQELFGYPESINLQISPHNCHFEKCQTCQETIKDFDEQIIIDRVNEILSE